ncbi:hypothetical protein [Nocardiopsis sp. CA-288880]|uniref:hypothetical protein n=1 Tax=Nocardiopsis sp. CA-288880 TaxID=3239995 RepID=UPI003D954AC4
MPRTTPPRPVDITAVVPRLAPLARTTTRLHPYPGSPSVPDSSIGGPLLWPTSEPWPYCDGPHERGFALDMSLVDLRLERLRAAVRGRNRTPQEQKTLGQLESRAYPLTSPPIAPHHGSVAMLPLAQLYARDVPDLPAPAGADLLQVLWCPFDHPPDTFMPRTALVWRSSAAVTGVRTAPPEPAAVQYPGYLPEPCLIEPEQVTEYPHLLELGKDLQELLGRWSTWEAAGAAPDRSYAPAPEEFYQDELSVAPGWKVGGWAPWGPTDPVPRFCPACGTGMDPLLTVATFEWDSRDQTWVPHEDLTAVSSQRPGCPDPRMPTAVQIASGYRQQLYICPADPEHPHTELMQ